MAEPAELRSPDLEHDDAASGATVAHGTGNGAIIR
jgi:hypothetical protein